MTIRQNGALTRGLACWLLAAALLTGCLPPGATPRLSASHPVPPTATHTPAPPTATATPAPPTATPSPLRIWFDSDVPAAVRSLATVALAGQNLALARSAAGADLRVSLNAGSPLARWVYVIVAPFPTLADGVRWSEVQDFWAGRSGALSEISASHESPTLFVSADTLSVLQGLLGVPGAQAPICVTASAALVDQAWAASARPAAGGAASARPASGGTGRPGAWAIVPFDELDPRWKALRLDGASVLDKGMDVGRYPLALSIGAQGRAAPVLSTALVKAASARPAAGGAGKVVTNREPERMTVLVMTGVTALVRGIADRMERLGIFYPAEYVGALLRDADVTHISNEVSFAPDCPPPDPRSQSLAFCSNPKYMQLLKAVGTDVIELTGNHVKDYGSQPMLYTLDTYDREGIPYFGGGRNLEDARKPLIVSKNGVKFGFIGCNPVGPENAWATADRPGAAPCDYEYVHSQLGLLKAQVDVPIATLQYWEFYQYAPTPQQRADFRGMVDAGAVIVSGSQAHHPQGFEFYQGAFIHYGPGNLFFDQMWSLGTRQEVVDRHVIYDGRHVSTELYTYLLEDSAQPRPMTAQERTALLTALFKASDW